tara:strand:+ start:63 stop:482 length:420 start_codon:yes stop_codon:yes gene_type:complete
MFHQRPIFHPDLDRRCSLRNLVDNYLLEHYGLSKGQLATLLALLEIPVMDYEVVEILRLYPRGKMRKNVIDPLVKTGWIVEHSLPPKDGNIGASRVAWSLKPDRKVELENKVREAEDLASKQFQNALSVGKRLGTELSL